MILFKSKKQERNIKHSYDKIYETIEKALKEKDLPIQINSQSSRCDITNLTYEESKALLAKILQYLKDTNDIKYVSFRYSKWIINGVHETILEKITIQNVADTLHDFYDSELCIESMKKILRYNDTCLINGYINYADHYNDTLTGDEELLFRNTKIKEYIDLFNSKILLKNPNMNYLEKTKNVNQFTHLKKKYNGCVQIRTSNWLNEKEEIYLTCDYDKLTYKMAMVMAYDRYCFLELAKLSANVDVMKYISQALCDNNFLLEMFPELKKNEDILLKYALKNHSVAVKCATSKEDTKEQTQFYKKILNERPRIYRNLPKEIQQQEDIWKYAMKKAIDLNDNGILYVLKYSNIDKEKLKTCIDKL